jgi:sphinganine-1-phosphate aldolase
MNRDIFPRQGSSKDDIIHQLKSFKENDLDWEHGRSFSYVYKPQAEIYATLKAAHEIYFSENALNPAAFPSLRKMEGEVVEMCLDLLGAGTNGTGSLTSGGTESIMMALKSAKEWSKIHRPEITQPEVLFANSAHPAFNKACDYFSLTPVIVPTGLDYRADHEAMEKHITKNTILMIGSAPSYPQGVVDPIQALGQLAIKHNILLHVDACVGGFVLPFLPNAPNFNLSTPGVSSISADIHKYGFASKGSSVVLYNDPELRKAQFYVYTGWPGGMYGSPAITGTRPGGAIAAAWTTLKILGRTGYEKEVSTSMKVVKQLHTLINSIPGLSVIGDPDMCIFSFGSEDFDIYELGDELYLKGWLLDRQQNPACLHISVSPNHEKYIEAFEKDLLDCIAKVKRVSLATLSKNIQIQASKLLRKALPEVTYRKVQDYALKKGGVEGKRSAALYGMIGDLEGSGDLDELIRGYLDTLMRKP